MEFAQPWIEAARRGLATARIRAEAGTGLFAATDFDAAKCRVTVTQGDSVANDDNYALAWVRDTLKASRYDLTVGDTAQVTDTVQVLLDYFYSQSALIDRTLVARSLGQPLRPDHHALMPRMHPLTLELVQADQGKNLQLDMAEFLSHLALASGQGIQPLRHQHDLTLVQRLIDYWIAWDYGLAGHPPGDYGIWEEGQAGGLEPDLHASSIAAMVAGFRQIQGVRLSTTDGHAITLQIPESMIERGLELLNQQLQTVGETAERPYDLTGLIILEDHLRLQQRGLGLLNAANQARLLAQLEAKGLERARGFVRYASDANPDSLDSYHQGGSPQQLSAEWPLGFCYAALIYHHLGQRQRVQEYIHKAEAAFDWRRGLGLPEAYYGGTDQPVPVSPLTWANALYLVVWKTVNGGF